MRRLFRFLARAFGKIIWFCVALTVSTLGVYFAYGVAGGEFSYNVTVAIIVATALGALVVAEVGAPEARDSDSVVTKTSDPSIEEKEGGQ
jgi:hypothetical protein